MPSVFAFFFILACADAALNKNLMLNYFEHKYCDAAIVFSCNSKRDSVDLFKFFTRHNLKIAMYDDGFNSSLDEVFRRDQSNLGVVVDGDCEGTETLVQNCGLKQLIFNTYHWLILGSTRNVINKFENVNMFINADVTVAISDANKSYWTVFDVYNPAYKNGGKLIVNEVGHYTAKIGYQVQIKGIKYYRRRNMTGTLFKTVMVVPERISTSLDEYLANDEDRHINTFTRFQSVVIRNCQDFFQFDVNMSLMSSWGYPLPNGDVDGMLKELKEKRIDYGNAPLMFKLYRLKVIDYGHRTWIMKSAFFFRHPKGTASSSEMYLQPLEAKVWIVILLMTILFIVLFRIVLMHEGKVLSQTEENAMVDSSWAIIIIYNIGEIGQQGFSYIPVIASARIVVLVVLIFYYLVFQFYLSSVVSNLLLEPPRTINTLLDLLNSDLGAGCENSLYDKDYIASTTDPVAIALYNRKMRGPHNATNFLSAEEGLKRVNAGGFAFHTQTATAYPIIETEFSENVICELEEVKMYATQTMYMTLPKQSPLKKMFNYFLIHQTEVGVMDRLRKHWDARRPECVSKTPYLKIEVGLGEAYWTLLVLGVGLFFGLLFLLIERVWKKWKKQMS